MGKSVALIAALAALVIVLTGASTPRRIYVPSGATTNTIKADLTKAAADGPGTTLVFRAGKFAYSGTFTVPSGINVQGQGIWKQGLAKGGGGTWLQCAGMRWGSNLTVSNLLVGVNRAGTTSSFYPAGHGSKNVKFSFVRFKGGSDSGSPLIDLGGNFSDLWRSSVETISMTHTTWNDCEFERPQSTNATDGTSTGAIMNIWWDSRGGGGQVNHLTFNRCHFGVRNGYNSGIDGYGIGRTIVFQPSPAEHASDGPRPSDRPDNMNFDWARVTHGASSITFTGCLFEYSLWYPMDVCDYARSYSMTTRFNGSAGGNPPAAQQAAAIPDRMWTVGLDLTRCYFKGSTPKHSVVGEIGKNCVVRNSRNATGGFHMNSGSFGDLVTGSFSNATRPHTALFKTSWSGSGTSYTRSPYDP